jgi:hypothetical protein
MLVYGMAAGLVLAVMAEAGRVLIGSNWHTVLPGRVYRCAQLSGPDLERVIAAYGIRTVVNLRGCAAPLPWYLEECRATQRADAAQEDICFSAGRLPCTFELRRLIEVLDRGEPPFLLHCRRGADRTGMAAAVVMLLQPGGDLDRACRQLGPRYGHVALGRPAYLDAFLGLYRQWLAKKRLTHSAANFRRWAVHDYCPAECRCLIEPVGPVGPYPRGRPFAVRVRATNTSGAPWHMQPESNAGVHARFILWNELDFLAGTGRSGLFRADVPPGGSIELTLALPALALAGRYRLLVDMVDEPHCWFYQAGSEPLEMELEVRE